MWRIVEHRDLQKRFTTPVPSEVKKRYEKWKSIVFHQGPQGLRLIKGRHDEALLGQWGGYRSSRLGRQWRAIYKIRTDILLVQVVEVNAHDYKQH